MAVIDFTFAKAIDDKHRLVIKSFVYFLFIAVYLSESILRFILSQIDENVHTFIRSHF